MCPYEARCDCPANAPAQYKVAARWSLGELSELKTYGLACDGCLGQVYADACRKRHACRLAEGESLEAPGVYRFQPRRRDAELERLRDLEEKLSH